MNLNIFSGGGYLLIGALILLGAALLGASLFFNRYVAKGASEEDKRLEKSFEYYRNSSSQLGIILIGIGVSLFIFFFQQSFQEVRRNEANINQILADYSVRLARAGSLARSFREFDDILDDGGPYANPEDGGNNRAVTVTGADLARQVDEIRLVERDVNLAEFSALHFTEAFERSDLVNSVYPDLWLLMVQTENDIDYATTQLTADYRDLENVLGPDTPEQVVQNPVREEALKRQTLNVLWDMSLLRFSSRIVIGRACWLISTARLKEDHPSLSFITTRFKSHQSFIEQAKIVLGEFKFGGTTCYELLQFHPNTASSS